ncbi:hypothetical protein ACJIZ3_009080 [Penstemon smallii]|uniref:Uncharacterized protein n=1 Tax=Penstemon smallii TaxID=265156 RepID=A0ABD3TBL7_9LAMI
MRHFRRLVFLRGFLVVSSQISEEFVPPLQGFRVPPPRLSPEDFSSFPVNFSRAELLPLQANSFLAMENHQSSSNSSGSGVSMGGRMCQCGAAVKLYTSYTKMNNGRHFIRCGGVPAHSINPGLLVRVNHLDDENRRMDTTLMAMEVEIRSLNASILELKAANLTLLHKLKLVKIFVVKMPLTRSQRAEMAACFDGWADHEDDYFIGRLQAAAREHDIRDMSACLGRRFSLPSLKYKLTRIRKDYHQFNGFLALSGVDYDQANNIVQIFSKIYWTHLVPSCLGCDSRFAIPTMNYVFHFCPYQVVPITRDMHMNIF